MRLLYAEDNEEIREILTLRFKSLTKGEVITCENGQEAIGVLEGGVSVDLIVSDHFMDGGTGLDLYLFTKRMKLNIPFILMTGANDIADLGFGNFLEDNPLNQLITKPPKMPLLKEAILKVMTSSEEQPDGLPQSESGHVPIRLKILYRAAIAPTDIYIKIRDGHFVKIYNSQDELVEEDIAKYERKNIETVYIREEEINIFLEPYMIILMKVFAEEVEQEPGKVYEKQLEAQELIHSQLKSSGMTEEAMELAKSLVQSNMKAGSHLPKIGTLIKQMMGKADFLYEHSLMIAYISGLILSDLTWDSKDTQFKLYLASMFHDMSLDGSSAMKDMELNGIIAGRHSENDIERFLNHPIDSSNFIHDFREIPPDTNVIISQHHELPEGKGFPKQLLSARTFPLSRIFIVSHFLVDYIYKEGFDIVTVKKCLTHMKQIFHEPTYEKILISVLKIFKLEFSAKIK
jgi:response regulator RpfG family c-di-GMP phosphodiesterase